MKKPIISNQEGQNLFPGIPTLIKGNKSGTPITMKNTKPQIAITPYGASYMMPNQDYNFAGNTVLEIPTAQMGGQDQQEQIMQLLQAYAQMKGMDPQQLIQQLQSLPQDQQQQALQAMVQEVQSGQGQEEQSQENDTPMAQNGGSLYDYVKEQGYDPSYKARKALFSKYFQEPYTGTAEQNMYLLAKLQKGEIKLGNNATEDLSSKYQWSKGSPSTSQSTVPRTDKQVVNTPKSLPNQKRSSVEPQIPNTGVIVNKRTGEAIVLGNNAAKQFPVLTGMNVEGNQRPLNIKADGELPASVKVTPRGYYVMDDYVNPEDTKEYHNHIKNLRPISAFGVPANPIDAIAMHETYNPGYRNQFYSMPGDKRNVTYGCTNCKPEDYINAMSTLGNQNDTVLVVDTKYGQDQKLWNTAKKQAQVINNRPSYAVTPTNYYPASPSYGEGGEPCFGCYDHYNPSPQAQDLNWFYKAQRGMQVAQRDATNIPMVNPHRYDFNPMPSSGTQMWNIVKNLPALGLEKLTFDMPATVWNHVARAGEKMGLSPNQDWWPQDTVRLNQYTNKLENRVKLGLTPAQYEMKLLNDKQNKRWEDIKRTGTWKQEGGEAFPQAQTYLPDQRPHETRPNFMFQEGGSYDIDKAYQIMKAGGFDMNPKKKRGGKFDPFSFQDYVRQNGGSNQQLHPKGIPGVDYMNMMATGTGNKGLIGGIAALGNALNVGNTMIQGYRNTFAQTGTQTGLNLSQPSGSYNTWNTQLSQQIQNDPGLKAVQASNENATRIANWNQTQGTDLTGGMPGNQYKPKGTRGFDFITGNTAIAGLAQIGDYFSNINNQGQMNGLQGKMNTSEFMQVNRGPADYGDWSTNPTQGTAFRPNQMTYTQQASNPYQEMPTFYARGGSLQEYEDGGVYDLTQDEIDQIIANGGTVEYI